VEREKEWSASSRAEKFGEDKGLVNMVGQWNVGIEVSVINPYTYSQGPVEKVMIRKENENGVKTKTRGPAGSGLHFWCLSRYGSPIED